MNADKLWRQYNAFRKRKSVQFAPSIYKALKLQIDHYIKTQNLNNLPVLPMQDALTELYKDVGRIWAANTFNSILKDAKVKYIPPQVTIKRAGAIGLNQLFIDDILEFFRLYILNLTTTITETTKGQIRDILSKGIENQWSLDEIINELQTTGITKMRAARISRTEVGRAANFGEQVGANRTGLQTKKIWIAVRDFRTREHHAEVDDQVRDDGKPFDVDGFQMQRPGDSNSADGRRVPASLIVNCRCTVAREVKRDPKTGLPLRKTNLF